VKNPGSIFPRGRAKEHKMGAQLATLFVLFVVVQAPAFGQVAQGTSSQPATWATLISLFAPATLTI
jgi:hypothetical protein